jgi:hypothetical protein
MKMQLSLGQAADEGLEVFHPQIVARCSPGAEALPFWRLYSGA